MMRPFMAAALMLLATYPQPAVVQAFRHSERALQRLAATLHLSHVPVSAPPPAMLPLLPLSPPAVRLPPPTLPPQTYGGGGGTVAPPTGGSFGSPPLQGGSFGGGRPQGGSFGNGQP